MTQDDVAGILHLDKKRGRALSRRHPWIFSGAIDHVEGKPGSGDTVDVVSSKGKFMARAAFSPGSRIRARAWTYDQSEQIDEDFFDRGVARALALRAAAGVPQCTDAYRAVFSEADSLPGFVADVYGESLVAQFLSAGAEKRRDLLTDLLLKHTGCRRAYERSDAEARALEGLAQRTGAVRGDEPPTRIEVMENGMRYFVDVRAGHKTGFYTDQRDNRALVRSLCRDAIVLDCFCYTGGFTVNALAGGAASVTAVDASEPALNLARENVGLNDLPLHDCEFFGGDAFSILRDLDSQGQKFDIVILDPPKFAISHSDLDRASRAYKDINMLGLRLLRPGGLLFTFSCSGAVDTAEFQRFVSWAALDTDTRPVLLRRLGQGADHPVTLDFPEAEYLTGLLLRKELD